MARKLDLAGVHVFKKVPGSQQFALSEVHPLLRLARDNEVLYLQDGAVFTAGGDVVPEKKLPTWFREEFDKCNPAVLAECGFKPKVAEGQA